MRRLIVVKTNVKLNDVMDPGSQIRGTDRDLMSWRMEKGMSRS
jgi:hypothetical protein